MNNARSPEEKMDVSAELLAPARREELAAILLPYARDRRWFRAKARPVRSAAVSDLFRLSRGPEGGTSIAVAMLEVTYQEGHPARDLYVVPLCLVDQQTAAGLQAEAPHAIVAFLDAPGGGAWVDALTTGHAAPALWALLRDGSPLRGEAGELHGAATPLLAEIAGAAPLSAVVSRGEQTNSTLRYGERVLLKIYRQLTEGENPEVEVGRFLTEHARPGCAPRVLAELQYRGADRVTRSVGIAHEYLSNEGDAWTLALRDVQSYFDAVSSRAATTSAPDARVDALLHAALGASGSELDGASAFARSAETLGRRTGELHLALASDPDDPAFAPEALLPGDRAALAAAATAMLEQNLAALRARADLLPAATRVLADRLRHSEARLAIGKLLSRFGEARETVVKTRTHGDLHLGQVLVQGDDFVIIDFEGEPARSVAERRSKSSPLRDVTGMLRSFDYAPEAVLRDSSFRASRARCEPWARRWTHDVSVAYLRGYLATVKNASFLPPSRDELVVLLTFYQLEKVIYEIGYEANNRPDWVQIPLRGLSGMVGLERGE